MDSLMFNILDQVDSTNNYAMGRIHEGLARNGEAWFARVQTDGKGQRGKAWKSNINENLLMSVIIRPPQFLKISSFYLQALVSVVSARFLSEITQSSCLIKWPNDLYLNDRKAGGILIENNIRGTHWNWAIIGIGININQSSFPLEAKNPCSVFEITQKRFDPVLLAKTLHAQLWEAVSLLSAEKEAEYMNAYNKLLYRREELVKLKKGNHLFEAVIKKVDNTGRLEVLQPDKQSYIHGEIEWLL